MGTGFEEYVEMLGEWVTVLESNESEFYLYHNEENEVKDAIHAVFL